MMMLVGCGINLLRAYRILRLIRSNDNVTTPAQRLLHSFFILCVGIGSTNVFLAGRSFTYHEAIMWGGAFSLLFTMMILKYLTQPRCRWLVLAGFFAFSFVHQRTGYDAPPSKLAEYTCLQETVDRLLHGRR